MVAQEIYFVGNSLGKYVYLLAGMHGVHIIVGIIFLFVTFVAAMRYKVHSKALQLITMCSIFWHFLDALWLFLYFFMVYNK
jgi:cytochrome c oxidase subunit 3